MHYPQDFNSQLPRLVNLSYIGDKVVKRSTIYIKEIYENIVYEGNEITYSTELNDEETIIVPNRSTYYLDELNRISKKIYYEEAFPTSVNDTLNFEYDQNGLLSKIEKNNNPYNKKESLYYFNLNKNLDSIVTSSYYLDYNTSNYEYEGKTVEVFSGYDSSPNPLKHLGIFDELFYRSLSTNNYTEYKLKKYNHLDVMFGEDFRNWSFVYDANGTIRFDLF